MLEFGSLQSLVYVDMVIKETLRKYPPTGGLPRKCTRAYTFRGTRLTIPEGAGMKLLMHRKNITKNNTKIITKILSTDTCI